MSKNGYPKSFCLHILIICFITEPFLLRLISVEHVIKEHQHRIKKQ